MKLIVAAVVLALVVAAAADSDQAWKDFKSKHGKQYRNKEHEAKARLNFNGNHEKIATHNARFAAGQETFELGHNDMSDIDIEEFRQTKCGFIPGKEPGLRGIEVEFEPSVEERQTTSVDYSTDKCMTPVKDQLDCGSCYAFSAVAALEFYNCRRYNLVARNYSEQQIVDCSTGYNNFGCQGGDYLYSYDYILKSALGIASSPQYPYAARNQACKFNSATMSQGKLSTYNWAKPAGNENALMQMLTNATGPINVAMDADYIQFYKSGVFNSKYCSEEPNHGVLLVGYGTLNGINYWKIKNSWGTNWGIQGYFLLERGVNRCGIASYPIGYPVV